MLTSLETQLSESLGNAYQLGSELHGGGMSRLFMAVQASLGREVVIKILPPELASEINWRAPR